LLRISAGILAGFLVGVGLTLAGVAWLQPTRMSDSDRAMAIRMQLFVRALFEPPINEGAASQWSPLLKGAPLLKGRPVLEGSAAQEGSTFSCSVCHGSKGEDYDRAIEQGNFHAGPDPEALPRERMVQLMEDWVEQLNHDASHLLRKAVVCTDCHERDPRRE